MPPPASSLVFALILLILDPCSGRVTPLPPLSLSLHFSLPSIPSILWIRKKPRSDIRTNTLMGFARSSGRGINKRSVGRGMKLEALVLVCWPLRCPVWLIKASPLPLCVAAGMCRAAREEVEIRPIWFKKKFLKKARRNGENRRRKNLLLLCAVYRECRRYPVKRLDLSSVWWWLCLWTPQLVILGFFLHAFHIRPSPSVSRTCQSRWMCVGHFKVAVSLFLIKAVFGGAGWWCCFLFASCFFIFFFWMFVSFLERQGATRRAWRRANTERAHTEPTDVELSCSYSCTSGRRRDQPRFSCFVFDMFVTIFNTTDMKWCKNIYFLWAEMIVFYSRIDWNRKFWCHHIQRDCECHSS